MNSKKSSHYRFRLAEGFLKETKQDYELSRWRACLDNAQRVIENSVKGIIAIVEPVEKTHRPAQQLKRLVKEKRYPKSILKIIEKNFNVFESLGPKEHLLSGYGDDVNLELPWDVITKNDAHYALENTLKCFEVSTKIYKEFYHEEFNV